MAVFNAPTSTSGPAARRACDKPRSRAMSGSSSIAAIDTRTAISVTGPKARVYSELFDDLWQYAETLKAQAR